MKLKPLHDQVLVIVGAASGIGRETALRAAGRGARLVVADNDTAGLQSLATEIRTVGGAIEPVTADTAIAADMEAVAQQAVDTFGRIDTWAHLAGVSIYATVGETEPDEFKRVVEVNLLGQIYGARAALPHLREGGSLIHVSSVLARIAFPLQGAYTASKHGVDGFVRSLRMEIEHDGLPINLVQILPSSINTPLFDKARTRLGVKPRPFPPVYEPGTVADLILYAAEHPCRDLVAGGAGGTMLLLQRISPRLVDLAVRNTAYPLQKTDQPKGGNAPTDLFGPIPTDHDRATGSFGRFAFKRSLYNWMETHPASRLAPLVALPAAVLGLRSLRSGR